jgi:hypothetical protein
MNYQAIWQEKAKKIPGEIFSRLEQPIAENSLKRALLLGLGSEFFVSNANFQSPRSWKIFISGIAGLPNNLSDGRNNLIILQDESIKHLASFPPGIFDLIVSLWDLPTDGKNNPQYIKNIERLLSKKGRAGIITYLDGSPKLPLNIIKKIISNKSLGLKIFKSALPDSASALRKMMYRAGFGDIRVWPDSIQCEYQSPEDIYQDIFIESGSNLFALNAPEVQQRILRVEFVKELEKHSFPLTVTYDFAGGTGLKP